MTILVKERDIIDLLQVAMNLCEALSIIFPDEFLDAHECERCDKKMPSCGVIGAAKELRKAVDNFLNEYEELPEYDSEEEEGNPDERVH